MWHGHLAHVGKFFLIKDEMTAPKTNSFCLSKLGVATPAVAGGSGAVALTPADNVGRMAAVMAKGRAYPKIERRCQKSAAVCSGEFVQAHAGDFTGGAVGNERWDGELAACLCVRTARVEGAAGGWVDG